MKVNPSQGAVLPVPNQVLQAIPISSTNSQAISSIPIAKTVWNPVSRQDNCCGLSTLSIVLIVFGIILGFGLFALGIVLVINRLEPPDYYYGYGYYGYYGYYGFSSSNCYVDFNDYMPTFQVCNDSTCETDSINITCENIQEYLPGSVYTFPSSSVQFAPLTNLWLSPIEASAFNQEACDQLVSDIHPLLTYDAGCFSELYADYEFVSDFSIVNNTATCVITPSLCVPAMAAGRPYIISEDQPGLLAATTKLVSTAECDRSTRAWTTRTDPARPTNGAY